MFKIYIKPTPTSKWVYKGIAKDLATANKVCNIYNARGCYTEKREVTKNDNA